VESADGFAEVVERFEKVDLSTIEMSVAPEQNAHKSVSNVSEKAANPLFA
jgi:hypothetical protein